MGNLGNIVNEDHTWGFRWKKDIFAKELDLEYNFGKIEVEVKPAKGC